MRWGVLGAGWLVNQATGSALHNAEGARFVSAAARDVARARATGAEKCFDSYTAVVEDPDIEAVYICLNNDAHLPWIRACIEAGKHVLCEKPLVMTAAEAEEVFAAAESAGVILVEAVWTRWHPRMQRIVELIADGAVGEPSTYLGTFTFDGVADGNYRLEASRGGGSLYDVGIYPLHGLFACLPHIDELRVIELEHLPAGADVDLTTKATLTWGGESRAVIVGSFTMPESQRLVVKGTGGDIRVDDNEAWASWRKPTELWVNGTVERFPSVDAYELMFESVSASIRGEDGWLVPARDSLRVAGAVDALLPVRGG